jgi:hypothetical protein
MHQRRSSEGGSQRDEFERVEPVGLPLGGRAPFQSVLEDADHARAQPVLALVRGLIA